MGLFGRKKNDGVGYIIVHQHLFGGDVYECSVCGMKHRDPFNFCSRCGARMVDYDEDPEWLEEMADEDELFGGDDEF